MPKAKRIKNDKNQECMKLEMKNSEMSQCELQSGDHIDFKEGANHHSLEMHHCRLCASVWRSKNRDKIESKKVCGTVMMVGRDRRGLECSLSL